MDPMGMNPETDPLDPQSQYMNPMHALWAGLLMDVGNIFGPNRQAQGLAPQLMLSVMAHNRQLSQQMNATDIARQRTQMGLGDTVQSVKEIINPDGTINLVAIHRSGNVKPLTAEDGTPLQAPIGQRYITDPSGAVFAAPTQAGAGAGVGTTPVISREQALSGQAAAQEQEERTKAQVALPEKIAQAEINIGNVDRVLSAIEDTRKRVSGWTTGWGSLFQYLPATDARSLRNEILRLKSNTFLDALGELRMMGGTVGQVTEREGEKIEGKWAAVDQAGSEEALNKALDDLVDQYRRSAENVQRELAAWRQKAGLPARRLKYNPETGRLE